MDSLDRSAYVRESMRRSWGARVRAYAEEAAPNTAAHAAALLDIVPARLGERVLDVATGPGVVAVAAARQVGPAGQVLATDLAPEWEAAVAARAAAAGVANVAFRTMDAGALDLPDGAFDVAYCQFGLMFVPQPVQALRELRRVLRSGGRLGVAVWSTPDKVPCLSVLTRHLEAVVPPEPPGRELPSPLALGAPGLLEQQTEAAGFRGVHAERRTLDFVFASPNELWRLRVDEGPPAVRAAVRALAPEALARLRGAVEADLVPYVRQGAVRLPSEAIYVTATK